MPLSPATRKPRTVVDADVLGRRRAANRVRRGADGDGHGRGLAQRSRQRGERDDKAQGKHAGGAAAQLVRGRQRGRVRCASRSAWGAQKPQRAVESSARLPCIPHEEPSTAERRASDARGQCVRQRREPYAYRVRLRSCARGALGAPLALTCGERRCCALQLQRGLGAIVKWPDPARSLRERRPLSARQRLPRRRRERQRQVARFATSPTRALHAPAQEPGRL